MKKVLQNLATKSLEYLKGKMPNIIMVIFAFVIFKTLMLFGIHEHFSEEITAFDLIVVLVFFEIWDSNESGKDEE